MLETTGIAEPAAILDGLVKVPEEQRERIVPAGVVCVVDAEGGPDAFVVRPFVREVLANVVERALFRAR